MTDKMRWIAKEHEDKFEALDAELDRCKANQTDWLVSLQATRQAADDAYNAGELAEYQWRVLVNKSARIQDAKNG